MLAAAQPYPQYFDLDGSPLDGGAIYYGTANADPQSAPLTVYWDAAGTQPAAQPIPTLAGYPVRAGTPAAVYVSGDYSMRVCNRRGMQVLSCQSAATASQSLSTQIDLASSAAGKGAALVMHCRPEAGALPRAVAAALNALPLNAVTDFGCDPTGATNSSVAMRAFFDACIANAAAGKTAVGYIPSGTYLITAGQLAFDCNFTDQVWPEIQTAGYKAVTFKRADNADAPMISLSNGTATSPAGKYWLGGSIGGITFDQNGKTTGSSQHGLSLRGVWGTKIGWMRANDQGGSCVYLPQALYGGNNPDPYAVTFTAFEGVEANRCKRFAFENRNYVGLTGCKVSYLRAINTEMGVWYGLGAGNSCDILSMGSCKGWVLDDGTNTDNLGGSPSRFTLGIAEMDDPQYGIRLNKIQVFEARQIRIIPRHNFSSLNSGEGYWPRIGVSIAGGAAPSSTDIQMNIIWRVEAGGLKSNLGSFIDFNNVASTNITINNRILDNAGFGLVDSDLFVNRSASGTQVLRSSGKKCVDDEIKVGCLVRSSTTDTVPNSGFGTATSKIVFGSKLYDKGSYYDTTNSWFTAPYSGIYRVSGRICLAVASGTRVKLGFAVDTAGTVATALATQKYQTNAGAETHEISGVVSLTAGQRLFFMAEQNTGAAVALSAPVSATADLTWSAVAL